MLANHAKAAGRGSKLSDDNGWYVDIAPYLAIDGKTWCYMAAMTMATAI